jgi:chromosomal replication initiator protein
MDETTDPAPSSIPEPIRPLRVFLCHSAEDKAAVRVLYHRLKSSGIEPWFDEFDLLPGQEWDREIGNAVRSSDAVLICLSSASVNKIGACEVPERLRQWQWVSLFDADGYDRLMVSLTLRSRALERLPPKSYPLTDLSLESAFSSLNPRFTFESFVVGASNQFAHAAARSVATNPSSSYNPLFICAGVGMGKTHLLHAMGHTLIESQTATRIVYTSSQRFMNDMITCIRLDRMLQFHDRYRSADVLLVDDIQLIGNKDRTQEEFFHAFNELHDRQKQIVISSDAPPRDIPGLFDRLRARFEWGLMVDIQPPDLEMKMAILDKKAKEEGVALPEDVRTFIATKTKSNVRELGGALVKLIAYSSLTGSKITLAMAQQVLRHMVSPDRRLSIDAIQKTVAASFNIAQHRLKERTEAKAILFPRQVAMYLVKELTSASLPEIGRAFGGKHHTTVLHSVSKISRLRQTDADVRRLVSALIDSLV